MRRLFPIFVATCVWVSGFTLPAQAAPAFSVVPGEGSANTDETYEVITPLFSPQRILRSFLWLPDSVHAGTDTVKTLPATTGAADGMEACRTRAAALGNLPRCIFDFDPETVLPAEGPGVVRSLFDVRGIAPSPAWRLVLVDSSGASVCEAGGGGCVEITAAAASDLSLEPSAAAPGVKQTKMTISGRNIWPGSTVQFENSATTFTPTGYQAPDPAGDGRAKLVGVLDVPQNEPVNDAIQVVVTATDGQSSDPASFAVRPPVEIHSVVRRGAPYEGASVVRGRNSGAVDLRVTGANFRKDSLELTLRDGIDCSGNEVADIAVTAVAADGTSADATLTVGSDISVNAYGVCAKDTASGSKAFRSEAVEIVAPPSITSVSIAGQTGTTVPRLAEGDSAYVVTIRGSFRPGSTFVAQPAEIGAIADAGFVAADTFRFNIEPPTTTGTLSLAFDPPAAEGGPRSSAASITFVGAASVTPARLGENAASAQVVVDGLTDSSTVRFALRRAGAAASADDPLLEPVCEAAGPGSRKCRLTPSGARAGDFLDLIHDIDGTGPKPPARQAGSITIAPAPQVNALGRSRIGTGARNATLRIDGTGFLTGTTAALVDPTTGAAPLRTRLTGPCSVSSTALTCSVDVDLDASGTVRVDVRNGDAGRDADPCGSACTFSVVPGPALSSVVRVDGRNALRFPASFPQSLRDGEPAGVVFSGSGLSDGTRALVNVKVLTPSGTRHDVACTPGDGSLSCAPVLPAATGAAAFELVDADDGRTAWAFEVLPVPAVTGANPVGSSGPAVVRRDGAAAVVELTGQHFTQTPSVEVLTEPGETDPPVVTGVLWRSATRIDVTVSAPSGSLAGARDLRITNPEGGTVRANDLLFVSDDPLPTSIVVGGVEDRVLGDDSTDGRLGRGALSVPVVVHGERFVPNLTTLEVAWVGLAGDDGGACLARSSTTISCRATVPPDAPTGPVAVKIDNHDSGTPYVRTLLEIGPAPTVHSIGPDTIAPGTSTEVEVRGFGFVPGAPAAIAVSGAPGVSAGACRVPAETSLVCTLTASGTAARGSRSIAIVNGDHGRASAPGITVVSDPAIVSVDRSAIGRGASGVFVTAKGAGLEPGATLVVEPPDGLSFGEPVNGADSIRVAVSVAADAPLGPRRFGFRNPDGGVSRVRIPVTVTEPPRLDRATPGRVGAGAHAIAVTVTGAGFVAGDLLAAAVDHGTVQSVERVDATTLRAILSLAEDAPTGSAVLTVWNGDGGRAAAALIDILPPPQLQPSAATPVGRGADNVVVRVPGEGIDPAATLSASEGVTAELIEARADGIVVAVAVAPEAALGQATLSIANPDGGRATCACLDIRPAPVVETGAGAILAAGGRRTLTLEGAGLGPGTTLTAAGLTARILESADGRLVAEVASHVDDLHGPRDFWLTNPDGGRATCSGCVEVVGTPAVERVAPSLRPIGGKSLELRLEGPYLRAETVFDLGPGVEIAGRVAVPGGVSLTIDVAEDAEEGVRSIVARNPGGFATRCACLELAPVPAIESITPASIGERARTSVVLRGRGFLPGTVASFGDGVVVRATDVRSSRTMVVDIELTGAAPGSLPVRPLHPDLGGIACEACLTVGPAPEVSGISPARVPAAARDAEIVVSGSGLAGVVAVDAGPGVDARLVAASNEQLTIALTARNGATPGDRTLELVSGDGGRGRCEDCLLLGSDDAIARVEGFGDESFVVRFRRDATNVRPSNVRVNGDPARLRCRDLAGSRVDCASGPVRRVEVRPTDFVMGGAAVLALNPPGTAPLSLGGQPLEQTRLRLDFPSHADGSMLEHRWASISDRRAEGGRMLAASSAGASMTFEVAGDRFTLVTPTGPDLGVAHVFVDGVFVRGVDLSSPARTWNHRTTIDGLGAGAHVVEVRVAGRPGLRSVDGATAVAVDAVVHDGRFVRNPEGVQRLRLSESERGERRVVLDRHSSVSALVSGSTLLVSGSLDGARIELDGKGVSRAFLTRSGARIPLRSGVHRLTVVAAEGGVTVASLRLD